MPRDYSKLLAKLAELGCSGSDLAEIEMMLDDDETADDDLEPRGGKMEPRGEDRALQLAMDSTDPYIRMRNYETAKSLVRPLAGDVLAADAAGVFKTAINKIAPGLLVAGLPKAAMPAVWRIAVRQHNATKYGGTSRPRLAMDAKQAKSFAERHPDAAKVRVI